MRPPAPFLPSLEGLRAVACSGIIITHVAFQTGADTGSLFNRMMARTDFFVPVFFALSGFLLWRRHRADFPPAAIFGGDAITWTRLLSYYVKRIGRIFPAYLALVLIVLAIFPVAEDPPALQMLANVTMTQIYVTDGLVGGLTHLWSLCVEMAFYLVLPLLALGFGWARRPVRIAAIVVGAALSFGWAFIPAFAEAPGPGELNPHIMPPAFTAWFAVGFMAAELESIILDRASAYAQANAQAGAHIHAREELPLVRWIIRFRWVFWLIALAALAVAASDGPEGLTHAEPAEFARRTFYGLVFAAALIIPYAVAPRSAVLESAPMQALGRWSYSIFLWHMAMLSLVFPLLGIGLFQGHTAVVLVATFVLTVPVAALSYALVEEPARRGINSWWARVKPGAPSQ
ncbi:MAG TPA: acyltransferase [Candidatus Corynebacterium gallistercoris]|uniref:Acyltransferase n=1 Tax=Candidatus Corynebacterium gallistercoris TaxID=2838530 RepID=A0A9D1RWF4_9CORY|nr:acyltransferase [Candidatus Corynebacterium gallistercoris]